MNRREQYHALRQAKPIQEGEPQVPDSFMQGVRDIEAGRVVDMDVALNSIPTDGETVIEGDIGKALKTKYDHSARSAAAKATWARRKANEAK